MGSGNSGFNFDLWKKIGLFLLLLFVADVFLASFWHIRYGDLLFVEGIFVFAAGAYIAAGVANIRRETQATLIASPEGHKEYVEEQRSKQVSDGILLMIIGAIVIAASVIYFTV
jgi:hypothetical protein